MLNHHITRSAAEAAKALFDLRRWRGSETVLSRERGALLAVAGHRGELRTSVPLDELVHALCREAVSFDARRGAIGTRALPPPDESLDRLCWRFGRHVARELGLLPRLRLHRQWRLLAWPDFGEIGSDAEGVALCRLLQREALSPEQAAARLGLAAERAHELFNAAALCGSLVPGGPRPASTAAPSPRKGMVARSAFGVLWGRLGA